MKSVQRLITEGLEIPSSAMELPTSGATVTEVQYVSAEETGGRTGNFYRVSGTIRTAEPDGYDIRFQAGFPDNWNGRLLQYGGGGFDGVVAPIEWIVIGRPFTAPSPLSQGYACCMSDSGHGMNPAEEWGADWALNQEALHNYAYAASKKLKDAIQYLTEIAYGTKPEKVYFAGGSNGGRSCLKAIQMFPEDYDGALCLYPVTNYILKLIKDSRMGDKLRDLGQWAWLNREQYAEVQKIIMDICDGLDGAEDGIIPDREGAIAKEPEILEALRGLLHPKQLEFLRYAAEPLSVPFPLGYGETEFPGYEVFRGAPMVDSSANWYGSDAKARDFGSTVGGDNAIRCMILHDKDYDLSRFVPEEHKEELTEASNSGGRTRLRVCGKPAKRRCRRVRQTFRL